MVCWIASPKIRGQPRFYERTAVLRPDEPFRYLVKIAKGELYHRYRNLQQKSERETQLLETIPDDQAPFEQALLDQLQAVEVWRIVRTEPLLSSQAFVYTMASTSPCGRSQMR